MTLRRIGIAGAAIVVGLGMLVLAGQLLGHRGEPLENSFLRRTLFGYARSILQRDYRLLLDATGLDFSLLDFRVGLTDVRLAAEGAADEPFFEADYLEVTLSPRVVFGDLNISNLSLTNALVRVHRRADGTTNLPRSSGGPAGDPDAIPIDLLDIPRLTVDVLDEQADARLRIPVMAVRLMRNSGSISFVQPGSIRVGSQTTMVSTLNSRATFDGRTLRLSGGQIRSDEATVGLDGSMLLIAAEPSMDLQLKGTGDIARLARWGISEGEVPDGAIAFDGQATGLLADPRVQLNATSTRITMGQLSATDLSARALASTMGIEVESLAFGVVSGRVMATASIPFAPNAERRVSASWTGVDTSSATRLFAPDLTYVPTGLSSGDLTASGTGTEATHWQGTVRLRVAGARNTSGRLAVPGETRVTLNDARWQVAARHALGGVAPVELDARGRLRVGQLLSDAMMDAGTATLRGTDLAAILSALQDVGLASVDPGLVTMGRIEATFELNGRVVDPDASGHALATNVAGQGFEVPSVRAEIAGRLVLPSLTYSLEAPDAVVAGERLRDLRADGRLVDAAGPLSAVLPTGATGSVLFLDAVSVRQGDGSGRLAGSASFDLASGRYSTSLEGADWQIVPTEDRPVRGLVGLRFSGTGTLEAPQGTGEIVVRDAAVQNTELGELTASVALEAGPVAQIEARAPDVSTTATVRVHIVAPYDAVIDVRTDRLDLARILSDVSTPAPIGGVASGSMHFEGALDRWRTGEALLEVTTLDSTVGGLPIRFTGPARIRYEDELLHIDRLEASAGETALSASGNLPAFDSVPETSGVLLVMTGGVAEVARAAAASGLVEVPVTGGTGPVALLARVTGSLQAPLVAADLEVGPGTISLQDLPPVSRLLVRAHAGDGWFELREGTASYQDAQVTATGRAPLSWVLTSVPAPPDGGAELRARATNVTAAILSPFLDQATTEQISGSIDVTLDATSTTPDLAALTGELEVERLDVRIADLPVTQRVPTRIVARGGVAYVEAWDWTGQGATLGVSGQVGLADRQAAILANGNVDLRVLTPFTRGAGVTTGGRFQSRISVIGPLENPRIDGDATIADGQVRLADPRVLVSDLDMQATLDGRSAKITSLTGTVNGGAMTGSGALTYSSGGGLDAQFSTRIRGTALEFPADLRSEVDADLSLIANSLLGAGRLSGMVTVVRGSYREPLAVVTGLLAGMQAQALTATAETSPFLSALALDIRLVTDEDIIVDNNYGRFELGADLRVIGTAAAPALSGRAGLREGGQLFVGRNTYEITSGAIDFTNPVIIEPNLNVQATTRAGGEDIQVTITGPANNPSVDLQSSSSPELGQAEVASLLLTGERLENLAPGDAAFVGTQVLGNFSAEFLGFAGRAVGLDTIRLGGVETPNLRRNPTESETDIDPTTRLTFGKNLRPGLNLTFSQSLRESDAQAWIVDYALRRNLEVRLVSNDEDLRSYGFRHELAFGATGRPIQPRAIEREVNVARVTAINISGDSTVPEERVRAVLSLAPGDTFDFADWQDDRDRVEELFRDAGYLTPRIAARRSAGPGDVVLTYEIVGGPQTRIVATGIDLDAALRSQLETAWTAAVFDDFLIAEASQIVRDNLARRGYLQPTLDVRVREVGDTKTLDIMVDPGVRSIRTVVRIEGAPETLAFDMHRHFAERGVVEGVVLDPGAMEREALAYLRTNGHIRARVSVGTPLYEEQTAVFPVQVDAGPVFNVAKVAFEGTRGLADEMLRAAAELPEGTPYDPGLLEGARNRLAALYRGEGFAAATVSVRPAIAEGEPTVDVVFVVMEGVREVLAEVVIVGNDAIDTNVVVQALDLSVGEPLRTSELLQGRTRLFNTGLFRRIDVASEPAESPSAAADVALKRLRVTVEEWPALNLRYGLLVAEEFRADDIERRELVPELTADVTRRTLFGRAIAIGAATGWQRRERRIRTFVNTPTLFGLPVESSLIAERSHEEFEGVSFVSDATGVRWEQKARLFGRLSLSYSYAFDRDRTFDTDPPPDLPAFDITLNIARLAAASAWDTRNNATETTRGLLASYSLEMAAEALGSDIRFVRQVAQTYYFRPWRSLVFASAARFGVVAALEGQDLIPSERFFSGGSRSVRGVPENGLGVRDFFGDPAGGEVMVVLNQEVRLPLYRWLRGVTFVDAGNVFAERAVPGLGDLVGALGVGLRLSTPFALLRVDFAKIAWGAPTTSGRWTFGIGHAF